MTPGCDERTESPLRGRRQVLMRTAMRRHVWTRLTLRCLLLVSLLVTGAAWVIASPVGASPDDDYHLDSIWCPHPVSDSCPTRTVNGVTEIQVPLPIGNNSPCYAFKPEESAACSSKFAEDETRWATRYDDGAYPTGYYRFHHFLTDSEVRESVLIMRTANVLIAIALLGVIGCLLPKVFRHHYAFALMASWIPMGIYFISSNNPSSWSITGTIATAAGMFGSIHSHGIRRWLLFAAAIVGANLSFTSRFDSALYIFVVAMALFFAVQWNRSLWIHATATTFLGVIGLIEILTAGRSGPAEGSSTPTGTSAGIVETIVRVFLDLPELFGGFYGFLKGPGWFDVPMDESSVVLLLISSGGALFAALRPGSWRKWMAALMVFGAMCGLPIIMVIRRVFDDLTTYQPRYLLPLLAVLFFFLFVLTDTHKPIFATPQLILFSTCMVIAHSLTLHKVLTRYVHGLSGPQKLNLNHNIQWWWDIPISPMSVWIIASLSLLIIFLCIIALTHISFKEEQESHPRATSMLCDE
ncbi:DUF2142 domain-containing protein [Schaalia vaccimaxillae]|uniref:DUF2142 domain-containing protein n=1 Tax=Schaalia vaccimaxillae TaxID=183916 RepID=UPI000A06EBA0